MIFVLAGSHSLLFTVLPLKIQLPVSFQSPHRQSSWLAFAFPNPRYSHNFQRQRCQSWRLCLQGARLVSIIMFSDPCTALQSFGMRFVHNICGVNSLPQCPLSQGCTRSTANLKLRSRLRLFVCAPVRASVCLWLALNLF